MIRTAGFLWCLSYLLTICAVANAADLASRPQTKLRPMLKITWSRGANLPQGFQDSDGGIIGDHLITVGGFCSGGLNEDNRHKPGRYPRGFLDRAWRLDLTRRDVAWQQLPNFPGARRQALSAANVRDELYVWGGFSYSKPYCYDDGWKLSHTGGVWRWDRLPDFPWPINSASMSVVGTNIYAFGGSDYNAEAFFTATDRQGKRPRLGARLLVFNTENPEAGWQELPACPGTPRWVHTMATRDGKLYVIGGASGNHTKDGVNYGYCTIVDNWSYNIAIAKWSRLRDSPIASGNFPRSTQNVFRERYVILPGGHQYPNVLGPAGKIRKAYGKASSANPKSGLHNDVFVYDLHTDLFGTADVLPIDNNLPMTVVRGDRVYLIGGETGGGMVLGEYYGHHPDLLLIGRLQELTSRDGG
jgi:hypothetical protein